MDLIDIANMHLIVIIITSKELIWLTIVHDREYLVIINTKVNGTLVKTTAIFDKQETDFMQIRVNFQQIRAKFLTTFH